MLGVATTVGGAWPGGSEAVAFFPESKKLGVWLAGWIQLAFSWLAAGQKVTDGPSPVSVAPVPFTKKTSLKVVRG